MNAYLDTSVIVALVLQDAHPQIAEQWLKQAQETPIVSDLGALEFAAVVSRQLRMGRFSAPMGDAALKLFDDWSLRMAVRVRLSRADMDFADMLVRDFELKLAGPDALHLAVAMNHDAALITFDTRLAAAARVRGAPVFLPG